MICVPDDFNLPEMYGGWKSAGQGVDLTWMTEEPKYHNSSPFLDYSDMNALGVQDTFTNPSNSNDWYLLSTSAANLSFSRGILDEHQLSSDGFPPAFAGVNPSYDPESAKLTVARDGRPPYVCRAGKTWRPG